MSKSKNISGKVTGIMQMSALLMCNGGIVSCINSCSGSVPHIYRHRFRSQSEIGVFLKPNDKWVSDLKMDQIAGTATQWKASDYEMYWEREVRDVDGNKVWFDCPVVLELDKRYAASMSLKKITRDRVEECGIENLYMESEYDADVVDNKGNRVDEAHAWPSGSEPS